MKLKLPAELLLFLLLILPLCAAGALDPSWKFRVLRSQNFELIYRENQKELAKRYLIAAEQAHELLFPIFKEAPYKTIIVLQDDGDSSNGLANFLPYPHITIYPVLPSTLDSIDEYGDWALEMMLHEYTHILNMYPAHGIYVPMKWIFGSVVRPNALLPKWYLEGLAVNLESALSDHGRLRSTETRAAARALVLGDRLKLEDVASINESGLSRWPYGGRPYLFGGWWWENVQREKGAPVIEKWNQNYSRRLPFFLEGPIFEQTSKSVPDTVSATTAALEIESKKEIEQIRAAGTHESIPVAEPKGEQSVFAVSPSGNRLVYWQSVPNSGSYVRLKTRTAPKQPFSEIESERIFKSVGTLKARWIDEDTIVYDKLDIFKPYVTFRDLFTFNVATKKHERLTKGQRAQDPAPSPSGKLIAFTQNDAGRNALVLLELPSKTMRVLVHGNFTQRISGPEFLNENELLFSVRQRSGAERLHVYNLETRKNQVWNESLKMSQHARRTEAGVLVADAGTRSRNVYLVKDGHARAVTNTLTDIQTADYDPQRREVLFSELTPEGRRLRATPLKEYHPPKLAGSALPPAPKATTTKIRIREESYQPILYLWPRYWIPFVYQVEDGFIFQGLTSNQDPVGRNQYSLLGSYDTVTKKPSYGVSYVNSSLPTDIGLSYAKSVSYLGASALTLESQSGSLTFSQYWPFNSKHVRWSLGGIWDETESASTITYRRMGPELAWQYSRLSNPMNERWGFHAELAQQQYLKQNDYMDYGRSYAYIALQRTLQSGKRILLQTRGALAPDLPHGTSTVVLGDRNVGGNYLVNLANSQFLLRGYPSGTFVGRKMVSGNLEFILPAVDVERGFGTFPLFLRNLELAAFVDTLAVDGAGFDRDAERYKFSTLGEFYTGAGAELRVNTTTAYHLPLALTVGLYYGFNDRFGGGFTPFFGIGFGGLSALENKTP